MAKKTYTVTKDGLEWAQASSPGIEEGKSLELDLEKEQETALVAAGWLIPKKG